MTARHASLRQHILEDPVSVLDLRPAVTLSRHATVREAMNAMRQSRVGAVVIVDEQGRLLAEFTERHLIRLLGKPGLMDAKALDHATTSPPAIRDSDTVVNLIRLMREQDVRFVAVIDASGKPVGLTGPRSVIEYVADHFPRVIKVQMMENKMHFDEREGA